MLNKFYPILNLTKNLSFKNMRNRNEQAVVHKKI